MLLISCWMSTVGRLLSQGEMSHSYYTKILKFFSFHSVSGQEDKFDPKRRKTRHISEKGTMFSKLVPAFSKGNSKEKRKFWWMEERWNYWQCESVSIRKDLNTGSYSQIKKNTFIQDKKNGDASGLLPEESWVDVSFFFP